MTRLFIGLDIGTSTIKALALDLETGLPAASGSLPTPVSHPLPDASEHDPQALWEATAAVLRQVTGKVDGHKIAGLAISCFGDTGLPLDKNGKPLYPLIAWYDRRCYGQLAELESMISEVKLNEITGQRFSTSLDAVKWLWIRKNVPGVEDRMTTWMPASSFLHWKLTGEKRTDFSIASRTLFFDQRSLTWSTEMLDLVGLLPSQLPEALPGGSPAGKITAEAAAITGLLQGTLCSLGGHDHLCALNITGAQNSTTLVDSSDTAKSLLVMLPYYLQLPGMLSAGYSCYAHVDSGKICPAGRLAIGRGQLTLAGQPARGDGSQRGARAPLCDPRGFCRKGNRQARGTGLAAPPDGIWHPAERSLQPGRYDRADLRPSPGRPVPRDARIACLLAAPK